MKLKKVMVMGLSSSLVFSNMNSISYATGTDVVVESETSGVGDVEENGDTGVVQRIKMVRPRGRQRSRLKVRQKER